METFTNVYKITLSSKDVRKFSMVFADFLKELGNDSDMQIPVFRVNSSSERIIIQISSHPQAFAFAAKIVKHLDNFSMSFAFEDSTTKKMEQVSRRGEEKEPTDSGEVSSEEVGEIESLSGAVLRKESAEDSEPQEGMTEAIEEPEPEEEVAEAITSPEPEKLVSGHRGRKLMENSAVGKIREYVQTLDTFTLASIVMHFPNMKRSTITVSLSQMKLKGMIISTGRGKYKVVK